MKVLALDTATPLGSIAALQGGRIAAEVALAASRGHSEHLLEAARFLLDRLRWKPNEPDLFVATAGPGSFTGLRIGIGTTRGLALAAGKPAAGVSTLAAMAAAVGGAGIPIAPILDAGRGEVYAALYSGEDPPRLLSAEALLRPGELMVFLDPLLSTTCGPVPFLALGSGALRFRADLERALRKGARILAGHEALAGSAGRFAGRLLEQGGSLSDLPLSARYIRRSGARLPKGAQGPSRRPPEDGSG